MKLQNINNISNFTTKYSTIKKQNKVSYKISNKSIMSKTSKKSKKALMPHIEGISIKAMRDINISDVHMQTNKLLETRYDSYVCSKCVKELTMYHITSKKNAITILNEGFNIKLSKRGAFGKGINLATDINHLRYYYDKEKINYIVVCKVKFYKKIVNTSGPEYIEGYTKPKFETPPEGYDALFAKTSPNNNYIYVIPNSEQVKPLYIAKIIFSEKNI